MMKKKLITAILIINSLAGWTQDLIPPFDQLKSFNSGINTVFRCAIGDALNHHGYVLANGWNYSAKTLGFMELDFSLSAQGAFSMKNELPQHEGLPENFEVYGNNMNVFYNSKDFNIIYRLIDPVCCTPAIHPLNGEYLELEIPIPGLGLGFSGMPAMLPQIGVGLGFGFELRGTILPSVFKTGLKKMKVSVENDLIWGLQVRNNLAQHISILKDNQISLTLGYQYISQGISVINTFLSESTIWEYLEVYNDLNSVSYKVAAYGPELNISKQIRFIELMGYLGYTTSHTQIVPDGDLMINIRDNNSYIKIPFEPIVLSGLFDVDEKKSMISYGLGFLLGRGTVRFGLKYGYGAGGHFAGLNLKVYVSNP